MSDLTEELKKRLFTELWLLSNAKGVDDPHYYTNSKDKQRVTDLLTDALGLARRDLGYQRPTQPQQPLEQPEPPKVEHPAPTLPEAQPNIRLTPRANLKWIPWAKQLTRGSAQGVYPKKYPAGLLVHFTAGHRDGLESGNKLMRNTGMLYLLIDRDGNLGQSNSLEEHGYHGGASRWSGLSGNVSDDIAGVEIQAAGALTKKDDKFYPWWDKDNGGKGKHRYLAVNAISADEVVHIPTKRGNIQPGYYQKYTVAQFEALVKLCIFLYLNNPDVFNVDYIVGHDEVAPDRKNDPGGALVGPDGTVYSMPEFREYIKDWIRVEISKNQYQGTFKL